MDKKLYFLHIPKTGGTSISKAFKRGMEKFPKNDFTIDICHPNICQTLNNSELIKTKFLNTYIFNFVRNPYDRITSEYRWRVVRHKRFPQKGFLINNNETFAEFVKNNLENHEPSYGLKEHYQLQKYYVEVDDIKVDFVGRFENLQEDFNKLCEIIGRPIIDLQWKNRTTKIKDYYKHYYEDDSEVYDIVTKYYKEDLEFFNYTFD